MYKQFSYVNCIQTNERNHKKKFLNNSKLPPINIKNSKEIFNNIYNKTRQKNWKPFHKRNIYFSKPYYLISKE